MSISNTIPKGKTLKGLLEKVSESPCHCNTFIEINKCGMVEIGAMDDRDYEVFWNCMRVYEACGINYFSLYIALRKGIYGDFTQGIKSWFGRNSIAGSKSSAEIFLELVDTLRFFEVSSYCGIDFSEFEKACQEASQLCHAATNSKNLYRNEKAAKAIKQRIENYFNFDDYSENKFTELSYRLITRQEKSVSINEALILARTAPQNTYIVILKRGNNVCHVGKTEQLLSYIGTNRKKFDVDSAYFEVVDTNYMDDLIVNMKVFYDIELDKIRPSLLNRKYATIKQAMFAYKHSEGISKKRIMSAIQNQKLRTVALENGQVLIDKIALHRALYPSKNIYRI